MNKIFSLSKKDIKSVPFQLLLEQPVNASDLQKTTFAMHGTWLLPQVIATLAKEVKPVKVDGMYDGNGTIRSNMNIMGLGSDWTKGFYFYLKTNPRGSILPPRIKATSLEMLPFAATVPLFMMAFKKYHGIKYQEWNPLSLGFIIDKGLHEAMMSTPIDYSSEELLELRKEGSTPKSGSSAGITKNPISVTTIFSTGDATFDRLPRLAKLMLCQCWVCHPSFRHEYMILDPKSWDNIPDKLISTEVIKTETIESCPWDE